MTTLRGVTVDGVDVVIVPGPHAYEGRCPHQGALLAEGELEDGALVCRNHRWRFDLETGQRIGGPQRLRACPLSADGVPDVCALKAVPAPARAVRQLSDLPGPPRWPLVGNALQFRNEDMHAKMEEWAARYGPMYHAMMGPQHFLVVSDAALSEVVLRARPEIFRRFARFEPIFQELGGAGVFVAEGSAWRAQRKLSMEAVAQRNVRTFYPTLAKMAERLRTRWERAAADGAVVDILDDFQRFTVDVTTLLAFGHDVRSLEGSHDVIQRRMERILPAINRRMNALLPYWRWVRMPEDRRVDADVAALWAWLRELIAQRRANPLDTPSNFLEAMITARDENGQPFAEETILGNAMTILVAGEDTTSGSLAWTAHHLCEEARVVATLREELDQQLGADTVPTTMESAAGLTYLGAVASEAMRLRPVAPLQPHEAMVDTVVGDVAVPRGTAVWVLARPPVMDPQNFSEPRVFRPERWLEGFSEKHEVAKYLPFGTGPRICPGRSLALLEMRVALATLYKNFDVTRVGNAADVREYFAITMAPRGLRVRLRPRPR